jgi:hypothetical protein
MSKRTPRVLLAVEELEVRIVPVISVTVPLDPVLDQFGDQVATVQAYGDPTTTGDPGQISVSGIFDTGASAVTFSQDDNENMFTSPIPIKVPGGAQAGGIGGDITGDVAQPATIVADGFHAASLTFDSFGFPIFGANFDSTSARTPGIQAMVGTLAGSPDLPTITGTPVLNPSPGNPNGLAARIDPQGYQLDLSGLIPGLVVPMPDLHFVQPGTTLQGGTGITDPVYVPMGTFGDNNYADPGDVITESPSPMQMDVGVYNTATGGTSSDSLHNHFLLDTGSQLTVISTAIATQLGLDLNHPDTSIDVQGVGGSETVPGFTISKIEVPTTDPNTVVDFTNVPIYVLDVAPGVDGLLGMNLFDTTSSMLYDPYNPAGATLGLTFFTDPNRGGGLDGSQINELNTLGLGSVVGMLTGHSIPGFSLNASAPAASFTTVTPNVRNSPVDSVTLTFNEAVTGVHLRDLHLTRSGMPVGLAGATLTTTDHIHWTIGNLAHLTHGNGQYQLTLSASAGDIKDRAGQVLTSGTSTSWTMDTVKPTVSISKPSQSFGGSNQAVSYTITYRDANFNQSTLSPGDVHLRATGTANGTIGVSGAGATRTVTISNITGNGTLAIALVAGTASDQAGNLTGAAGPGASFIVDDIAPTVTIGPPSPAVANSAQTIRFQVHYADAHLAQITLSPADILVNSTGSANAATITISGTGMTRTVALSGLGGDGTLGITLAAGTAVDRAGNPAPAPAASAVATVHAVKPTASFTPVNPDPTTQPVTSLQIVFSVPASGLALSSFSLTRDGTPVSLAGARLTTTDRQTWVLTLPAAASKTAGSYRLVLGAKSPVHDQFGNPLAADAVVTWTKQSA